MDDILGFFEDDFDQVFVVLVVPDSNLEHELANLENNSMGKVSASDVPPSDVRKVELKELKDKLFKIEFLVEVLLPDVLAFAPAAPDLEPRQWINDFYVAGINFGGKLEVGLQVADKKYL